jgi:urease accessory protein UreE
MRLLPKPDNAAPLLNDKHELSWQIAREYMRAMEMAAQAVDIMAQLANEIHARHDFVVYENAALRVSNVAIIEKAIDDAGLTSTDCAAMFGPLRDCCSDRKAPALWEKVAIGAECFSQMARVRKERS